MSKYKVFYEMRKDNKSSTREKTCECESEQAAIQIARSEGEKMYPGFTFILKRVEVK